MAEPVSYLEAMSSHDSDAWQEGMLSNTRQSRKLELGLFITILTYPMAENPLEVVGYLRTNITMMDKLHTIKLESLPSSTSNKKVLPMMRHSHQ